MLEIIRNKNWPNSSSQNRLVKWGLSLAYTHTLSRSGLNKLERELNNNGLLK
jgi:hypothetical protein